MELFGDAAGWVVGWMGKMEREGIAEKREKVEDGREWLDREGKSVWKEAQTVATVSAIVLFHVDI